MIFNPLYFFKKPWIYKENCFVWLGIVYESLVGNFGAFGFLDYVFVLPGLVKLACNPVDDSRSQYFLRGLSNFISIFKHVTAFFLTLAFIPLTYALHSRASDKVTRLKNTILEMEVLPVNEEKLKNLDYKEDSSRRISKEKLVHMFCDGNSKNKNRIKFKNHPNLALFLQDNMENHMIAPIHFEDEKGTILQDRIFGLFPCISIAPGEYRGMVDICEDINSRSIDPRIIANTFPVLLFIPSKENTKEMMAMERLDAFFFSDARDENRALKDKMGQYSQQEDPFKKSEQQRRNIQFSLEQV